MPEILNNLSLEEFKTQLNILHKDHIIIVRFTAEWCGPCKSIDSECNAFFSNCSDKIHPIIIDIDESLDLYVALKRYKMINGIPALFAYYGNDLNDKWYIPNNSIVGADKKALSDFFIKCINKVK